jgi:hypothetical protein
MVHFAVRVRVKECDITLVQGPYSRTCVNDSSPGTVNKTIKVEAPIYTQQKKKQWYHLFFYFATYTTP